MGKPNADNMDNAAIAGRLKVLRRYISGDAHGSRAIFAARIGIEYKRWNNFERGYPIPRDMAIHLVQAIHGLTLDWIYLGREDGLPVKLQRELAEAGKGVILPSGEGSALPLGKSRKPVTKSRA
jgi:hypothetical protein